ncbi:hypothetical protein [Jiangella muralis]|uniref:hypothetical protein n=1 Tax=Jiangella muralis TaxID=702383 RepID=UPI00069FBE42|nr:hypothetical protein [Jiangella muralis]
MARPISIPIVSDVSGFIKGTSDVERALDDVADSLDDVSREAQNAGDDAGRALSDGIEDGARDAERALDDVGKSDGLERVGDEAKQAAKEVETAAEKMERSFKDAFDSAKKESDGLGTKVGTDTRRGFDEASEGAREFKDEANSTAKESAASFDGSAASIGDAFQEIAANAFAGFGPAGAAAGLAIAGGLGFAFSAFEKSKEEAQKLRDRIGEIRDNLIDVRVDGGSALGHVAERIREIISETDEANTGVEDFTTAVRDLSNIDFEEFARGLAGDPAALDEAIRKEKERLEQIDAATGFEGALERARGLFHETERERANERLEILEAEREAQSSADSEAFRSLAEIAAAEQAREERAEAAAEAGAERAARVREAMEHEAEAVTGLTEEWQEHFDAITDDGKISMEELTASLDQMLADQARKAELYAFAQTTLTAEQMAALETFGEDRWAVLDTLMNTPPEARASTLAKLQAAGAAMGRNQMTGFKSEIPDEIQGPRVRVDVNDSAYRRWASEVARKGVTVPLRVSTFGNQLV